MDVIDQFILRYIKEHDYYDKAARLVAEVLEASLQAAGVRCIITSRAKAPSRVEAKCKQRASTKNYTTIEAIYSDIVDLAGVRVALYFPAERDEVEKHVRRLFARVELKKSFPDNPTPSGGKRFSGYVADHYRLRLVELDLNLSDRRYAGVPVEVQVASVLMHAWSEVEHDLAYKPQEGDLSLNELAMLDQLNGLVVAGEIALESLQRAGRSRVATAQRAFRNHYELAIHLIDESAHVSTHPIRDTGMGRVDLLFDLLEQLQIDTPEKLAPYLNSLHANVEERTLAEQVVDALISEDESRYQTYLGLRDADRRFREDAGGGPTAHRQIGHFLTAWIQFETMLRELTRSRGWNRRPSVPSGPELLATGLLINRTEADEFDNLRRLRNYVVHGIEPIPSSVLEESANQIERLIVRLRRAGDSSDDGDDSNREP